MRRNRLWKQVLSVTLAATMVFSLPSQAVFAEDNSTNVVSVGGVQQSPELDGTETAEMEETETGAAEDELAAEETEDSDTEVAETEGTEAVEETEETETGTEAAETEVTETEEAATEAEVVETEVIETEVIETEAAETEELEIVDEVRNATAAEDFSYEENDDGTITITEYTGSDTEVVIPETIDGKNVTSIGDRAFYWCDSLTSIEIPSSVKSIGYEAFYGCISLTSIEISSGVTSIEGRAFSYCSKLVSIVVDEENEYYNSGAGSNCIIETETNTLISGCKNTVIPSGVTNIGYDAFYECEGLTGIEIPSSVTSIGYDAFWGCEGLTGIEIPSSVTNIGDGAFAGCDNLTSIAVDEGNVYYNSGAGSNCIIETETNTLISGCKNTVIPSGVMSIGYEAFYGCSGLTGIEILSSVTSIGEMAFALCSNLISIEIPSSVTSIGNCAFYGCDGLTEIEIPSGVTNIGRQTFSHCSSLTSIVVDEENVCYNSGAGSNCIIETATNTLISGCKNTVIPSGVTSIGYRAFGECNELTGIEIPESVTNIEESAFDGCYNLTRIRLLPQITSIGNGAFDRCSHITIYCAEDTCARQYAIAQNIPYRPLEMCESDFDYNVNTDGTITIAKYYGDSAEVVVPETIDEKKVTAIGDSAFKDNDKLTKIEIPSGVVSIGDSAFAYCYNLTTVGLPESLTSIGNEAFYDCDRIQYIMIPENVTSIGDSAFYDCDGLTVVRLPEGLTSIGSEAFYYCHEIKNIKIPESVTSIGNNAFASCWNLTIYCTADSYAKQYAIDNDIEYKVCDGWNSDFLYDVNDNGTVDIIWYTGNATEAVIPETIDGKQVTCIGNNAFLNCSFLKNVVIPEGVTKISERAFSNCTGLTEIVVPSSTEWIESIAFDGCSGLTSIVVDEENTVYNSGTDSNCIIETETNTLIAGCKNTIIPSSVTSIGSFAFDGCSGLTGIEIPSSVTSIGVATFQGCSGLTGIEIPSSVTNIGEYAFGGCSGLTGIEIPSSVTSIEEYAFGGCSGLTGIEIPSSVTSIGKYAFQGCSGLTGIEIPSTVTSIGDGAFSSCNNLTSIVVDEGNEFYNSGAGGNCIIETATNTLIAGCKNTVIPSGVTSIGDSAFSWCSDLAGIEIPSGVTSIGDSAFYECGSLTSIEIPSSVTSIGDDAFSWCSDLTGIEIPSSVTSIGDDAFLGCDELTIYCTEGSYAKQYAIDNDIPYSIIEEQTECSHTNTELRNAASATCTTAGYSGDTYCRECGELISKGTSVPVLGHSYTGKVTTAATVNTEGVMTYTCDRCGDTYTETIAKLTCTHSNTELRNAASATCTTAGYTGDTYCKDCGELISKGTSVPALGHSYTGKVTTAASLSAEGVMTYTCDRCGDTYTETIAKLTCTYTVKFDGNGANSGSIADQSMTYGSGSALNANAFQRKGYTFKGWNTKADGSGTTLADKADGSALTETDGAVVILYAKWSANKYTITFNGNGSTSGSMKKLSNLKYGKTYTLTKNSFKKKGYTFKGWNTKKDGSGKTYKNKAEIKNLSAKSGGKVTLYAKWSKTKYTITYNLNKGKNNKNNPSSYNITTKTIKLKNPTRKGYTFKGWYSDKKCTKKVTQIKKGSTGNITLYAKWAKKK